MKKIPLLSLALLVTNTSLQAQTIAVDTDIQHVHHNLSPRRSLQQQS